MEASAALSVVLRELEGPALKEARQKLTEALQTIEQLQRDLEMTEGRYMFERNLFRGAYDDQYNDFTRQVAAQKQEIRSLKQQLKQLTRDKPQQCPRPQECPRPK